MSQELKTGLSQVQIDLRVLAQRVQALAMLADKLAEVVDGLMARVLALEHAPAPSEKRGPGRPKKSEVA